jgi:hypothetical protein
MITSTDVLVVEHIIELADLFTGEGGNEAATTEESSTYEGGSCIESGVYRSA